MNQSGVAGQSFSTDPACGALAAPLVVERP